MTIRAMRAANAQRAQGAMRSPEASIPVKASDDGVSEIRLYGAIYRDPIFENEFSAAEFVAALDHCPGDVLVRINSPGGVVTEGMNIYNALKEHGRTKGKVTTQVDGVAASIAADILCAGSDRQALGAGAFVMIHKAWGLAVGNADELEAYIPTLRKMDQSQLNIFDKVLSETKDDIEEMMKVDTWFTAEDALASGFVNKVLEDDDDAKAKSAQFDYTAYGDKVPKALIERTANFNPRADVVEIPSAVAAQRDRRLRLAQAEI